MRSAEFARSSSEREALLRLRAGGAIDDDVMRSLERELDLEGSAWTRDAAYPSGQGSSRR